MAAVSSHIFCALLSITTSLYIITKPAAVQADGFFGINEAVEQLVEVFNFGNDVYDDLNNSRADTRDAALQSTELPLAMMQQQPRNDSIGTTGEEVTLNNSTVLPSVIGFVSNTTESVNDTFGTAAPTPAATAATFNATAENSGDDPASTPVANGVDNNRRDADQTNEVATDDDTVFAQHGETESEDVDDDTIVAAAQAQKLLSSAPNVPTTTVSSTNQTDVSNLSDTTAVDDNATTSGPTLILPELSNLTDTEAATTPVSAASNATISSDFNTTTTFGEETGNETRILQADPENGTLLDVVLVNSGRVSAAETTNLTTSTTVAPLLLAPTSSAATTSVSIIVTNVTPTIEFTPTTTAISTARLLPLTVISDTSATISPSTTTITTREPETLPVLFNRSTSSVTTSTAFTTLTPSTLPPLTEFVIPFDFVTPTLRLNLCKDAPAIQNSYSPNVTCTGRVHACTADYTCVGGYQLIGSPTIACRLQPEQQYKWDNPPFCQKPNIELVGQQQNATALSQTAVNTLIERPRIYTDTEKYVICGKPPYIENAIPIILCTQPLVCTAHHVCHNNTVLNYPAVKLKCMIPTGQWLKPTAPLACVSESEAARIRAFSAATTSTTTTATTTAIVESTTTSVSSAMPTTTTVLPVTTKSVLAYTPRRFKPPPTFSSSQLLQVNEEARASALAEKVARICGEPPQMPHTAVRLVCGSVSCTAFYFCQRNYTYVHSSGERKLKCTLDANPIVGAGNGGAIAVARWPNTAVMAQCVSDAVAAVVQQQRQMATEQALVQNDGFVQSFSHTTPCGPIPNVPNAKVVSYKDSTVRYACLSGFALTDISTDTLRCKPGTNQWNSGIVQCVRLDELDNENRINQRYRQTDQQAKGMPCDPGYRPCQNGICVHLSKFCDTIFDCTDRSDERDCYTYRTPWEYTSTTQRNVGDLGMLSSSFGGLNANGRAVQRQFAHEPAPTSYYLVMSIPYELFASYRSCERPPPFQTTAACNGYYAPYYTFDYRVADCLRTDTEYGCPTTPNMFRDMSSCRAHCIAPHLQPNSNGKEHCLLAPVVGACPPAANVDDEPRYAQRWYYDVEHQKCRNFLFSGCSGNANRFDNETACSLACSGVHLEGYKPVVRPHPPAVVSVLAPSVATQPRPVYRYTVATTSTTAPATSTTSTTTTPTRPSPPTTEVCPPRPVLKDAEVWYERETNTEESFYSRAMASGYSYINMDADGQQVVDRVGTRLKYRCLSRTTNLNTVGGVANIHVQMSETFAIDCVRSNGGILTWQVPADHCSVLQATDMRRNTCGDPPVVDNATSRISLNVEANRFETYYRCDDGFYFASYPNYSEPYCQDGQWRHGAMPRCRPLTWAKGAMDGGAYGADSADSADALITTVDGGRSGGVALEPPPATAENVSNLSELAVLMQFNFDRVFRKLSQVDRNSLPSALWHATDASAGSATSTSGGTAGGLLKLLTSRGSKKNKEVVVQDGVVAGQNELNDEQLRWLWNRLVQLRRQTSANTFNAGSENRKSISVDDADHQQVIVDHDSITEKD